MRLIHDAVCVSDGQNIESAPPASRKRLGFTHGLEWCAVAAVAAVAVAAIYRAYFVPQANQSELTKFAEFQMRVHMLAAESDPIERDVLCLPGSVGH